MRLIYTICLLSICLCQILLSLDLGVDAFFEDGHLSYLKDQRIGLITNQTGVNKNLQSTISLFKNQRVCRLVALFAPEHGIDGLERAGQKVDHKKQASDLPVYSLYGKTRRPTKDMLDKVDVLIYDIQDIGVRSYTYATTLFYVMEEAAKHNIKVIVLDRPNPINGLVVDGPMLDSDWRSFIGYINVPYCHGMTIGELSLFFNKEYKIGCDLKVVKMKGWERQMSFKDTKLRWIPTSPHIPEGDTPLFYAATGLLGELNVANIGVGYTIPFKLIGAPWINSAEFCKQLNAQKLPGVVFVPFAYRPFYGSYKDQDCQGTLICPTNPRLFKPVLTQYAILGLLKSLYPKQFDQRLRESSSVAKKLFCQAHGSDHILKILENQKYVTWALREIDKEKRQNFLQLREKYLLY
ncbi:MAG: exo-beta-N-acetylmuramidase NamZ domain-containing protein [Rhabdochlamydiaceae bacterium]